MLITITKKMWRSIVLLVSVFAVISLTGCGAKGAGGGVFNQPLVYNVPADVEDKEILLTCFKQVSDQRVKEGKVPIVAREDKMGKNTERLLKRLVGGVAGGVAMVVGPAVQIATMFTTASVQDSRDASKAEAEKAVGKCMEIARAKRVPHMGNYATMGQ